MTYNGGPRERPDDQAGGARGWASAPDADSRRDASGASNGDPWAVPAPSEVRRPKHARRKIGQPRPRRPAVVEFWWLAFDQIRRMSTLSQRVASLGLAAALLWDLREYLDITAEYVVVVGQPSTADPAELHLLRRLAREGGRYPLITWLNVIRADEIFDRTVHRLVHEGEIRVVGWRRNRYVHVGANRIEPALPAFRLRTTFQKQGSFDEEDLIFLALILACGLEEHVFEFDDHRPQAIAQARQQLHESADPVLRALHACIEAVVASAVAVGR